MTRPPGKARAVLRLCRPAQWVKNLLVFAAVGAAGDGFDPAKVGHAAVVFVAFCAAAGGGYCLNDARDVLADRAHPTKARRPVADGTVSVADAQRIGAVLMVAGVALASTVGWKPGACVAAYVLVTAIYSLVLKHVPVLDILVISGGFLLRALAGGAAAGVPLSGWFLIVASTGSLLVGAGKRSSELEQMGLDAGRARASLDRYPVRILRPLAVVSAVATVAAYGAWAFEKSTGGGGKEWAFRLSIVPFAGAITRYLQLIGDGQGSAPDELLLRDRFMRLFGALWLGVFGIGVLYL